ncbi:ester cyclase [Streptomyces sp. NPDC005279]|uniref:ester cyclase n=1 Tax=Streptomyces sp. NPDC005279 TaxID=3364712 RepID=UPI0036906413
MSATLTEKPVDGSTVPDRSIQERNKELALSMVAAWNRWELDGIIKHWAPDIRHFSEDRQVDSQAMVGAMQGGLAAFPDLHLDVKSILAEDDRVALRLTVTASQQGEFMGKAPTGRKVTWFMLEELRFNDAGQVIEHYDIFNYLPMLKELEFVASDVL